MTKICVAVSEASAEDSVYKGILAASQGADMVEIRFDALDQIPQELELFKKISVPIIATLRTKSQGGACAMPDAKRLEFLKKCSDLFEYVDIEYDSKLCEESFNSTKIVSFHDFLKTPDADSIIKLIKKLQSKGDIAKAAFWVRSVKDLHNIIVASESLSGRYVLIGMGEMGELTRICSKGIGSEIAYASLRKGEETAPGQIDIKTLRDMDGLRYITGIIGNPIGHSRSPAMHNAAFESLNIPGRYFRLRCEKNELDLIIKIIRKLNIRGINVTIPHKQEIIKYLDKLDPSAESAGAVNCIINENGVLTGVNTDISGFRESFYAVGEKVSGKKSLIIGAGGAARACATFLSQDNACIYITNRTKAKAESLAKEFHGTAIDEIAEDFEIVVNCTPIGMEGIEDSNPITNMIFHKGQVVMDAVPVPEITAFLEKARENHAKIISGREMLIYQALDAFEIWTGRKAEYSVMSDAYGEQK